LLDVVQTALQIAESVRSGGITAVQIAEEHLARIRKLDTTLGAFVAVRETDVLRDAARVDIDPRRSELPLAGVPVAVKDTVDVAGYATRQGSAATPAGPARADDELIRRLRAAGAVVMGKTKLPELAIWGFTEPAAFGVARNPWDPQRTPGGSTGGGAAAVASGMAALSLGSDGLGSIRIPSACCGIFGLRPAPGLVPQPGGASADWLGLSAYGPMARNVADAALMLDVLAGSTVSHLDSPRPGLRVATSVRHPTRGAPVTAEMKKAVADTGLILEVEGHSVLEADPPYPADLAVRLLRRWLPGIAEHAEGLDGRRLESRTRRMAQAGRFLQRRGWAAPAADDAWAETASRWFEGFDLLVMPVLAYTAPAVGRWEGAGWVRTALSSSRWVMTGQWNLAGVAAAALPAGVGADGLPLAVQLVAPAGRESLLLQVAARIEARRSFQGLPAA
jgi:amidase